METGCSTGRGADRGPLQDPKGGGRPRRRQGDARRENTLYIYIYIYICVYTYIYIYTIYIHTYTCVYIYIYMYIYIYIYLFIYIHISYIHSPQPPRKVTVDVAEEGLQRNINGSYQKTSTYINFCFGGIKRPFWYDPVWYDPVCVPPRPVRRLHQRKARRPVNDNTTSSIMATTATNHNSTHHTHNHDKTSHNTHNH